MRNINIIFIKYFYAYSNFKCLKLKNLPSKVGDWVLKNSINKPSTKGYILLIFYSSDT